jgi:hypothetical protein
VKSLVLMHEKSKIIIKKWSLAPWDGHTRRKFKLAMWTGWAEVGRCLAYHHCCSHHSPGTRDEQKTHPGRASSRTLDKNKRNGNKSAAKTKAPSMCLMWAIPAVVLLSLDTHKSFLLHHTWIPDPVF